MKVLIPPKEFEELTELLPAYLAIRGKAFHGKIDQGGVIFSWDAEGNVYIESYNLQEVKE